MSVAVVTAAGIGLGTAPAAFAAVAKPAAVVNAAVHAFTLDNVALKVSSPDIPSAAFSVAAPGTGVQVASAVQDSPFSYFSVTAVPFGQQLPESVFPVSKAGDSAAWRAALHSSQKGPVATIFGQKVIGVVRHSQGDMTGKKGSVTTIETVQWVVDQGNRTWVFNLQHDQSRLPKAFGAQLVVTSPDSGAKTTVDLAKLKAAPAPARLGIRTNATVPLGANLGMPSWWTQTCNGSGTLENQSFMGLQDCSGNNSIHDDVPGVEQDEWQCADLSDRYLVQRYGFLGKGGNGNQVVPNAYNAYSSMFDLYSNGDTTAPVPGDVLSFNVNTNDDGHTGVVYQSDVNSSGNGTVYFVDQNFPDSNGYNSATVTDWNVADVTGEGGTVEWLHNPSDTPVPIPTASLTGVASGAVLRGDVSLSASVSSAASEVEFLVDGSVVGTATSSPYQVTWNTTGVTPGVHSVSVKAENSAGQWGAVSAATSVFVAGSAPVSNTVVEPNGNVDILTVDAANEHLIDTYNEAGAWHVTDVTASYGAPEVEGTPKALVEPNGDVDWLTINAANGHVMNTNDYNGWHTSDLTSSLGTPAASGSISADVEPNGNVDFLTVDAANGHLYNTYKEAGAWHVTDVSSGFGAPVVSGGPTALVEPNGDVDWLTINAANGDVMNTNDFNGWHTSDLTSSLGTPVGKGSLSADVEPNGNVDFLSVASANGHLYDTYKEAGAWHVTDVSSGFGAPVVSGGPTALVEPNGDVDWLTINAANGDVMNTNDFNGWHTSDLTSSLGTPAASGSIGADVEPNGNVDFLTAATANGDLDNTYSQAGVWHVSDVTTDFGTPALG
ncbi:Ig-like domain-containing protein [Streptacidiphilus sp. P02-A3a]|uniref:Ig-like domain-containing protein n=1 Tax=Streptacidiphilus sp. P02-A3a TaxID=2704468 RepID=UPI0015FA750B|nr:Ig-like domain-containing protein [Streptacidiphilus sp. P02-A3a]QMU72009.1 CHAP domain-containing protein [Streptacidiphilus sp. P02-A3a]